MKISREQPDFNARRWADWHIVTAAEAEFSMLDIYGRFQRGLELDTIRKFAAAINASGAFGTLHPRAQISAIPSWFFRDHADSLGDSVMLEFNRCIADFVEANRRTIQASRILVDFHLSPAPVPRRYVEATEEAFRVYAQAGELTGVVIFE